MSLDETHRHGSPTVLLVEDDPSLRKILLLVLTKAGFETACAANGREALAVLEEKPPSVVVLDLGLPDGLGSGVCAHLRRLEQKGNRSPARVVISGLDFWDATRQYGQLDCPFLAKPFNPLDLVRLVERTLLAKDQPLLPGGEGNAQPTA